MNRCRTSHPPIWFLAVMAFSMLFVGGCGKKAMPVPPNRVVPPAVSDLKGELKDGQVLLTWSLPDHPDGKSGQVPNASPAGVMVYRSKLPLEAGGCKNCPLRFEPIATLTPPSGGKGVMRYRDSLESGFRYTYKVILTGVNDAVSPDSDLLDLSYP